MAWLRLEKQEGMYEGAAQYNGICEEDDDLTADSTNGYSEFNGSRIVQGSGSAAYCLEDGQAYIKKADKSWGVGV